MLAALLWGLTELVEGAEFIELTDEAMFAVDATLTAVVAGTAARGGDGIVRGPKGRGRNVATATTPTQKGDGGTPSPVDPYDHYMFESPCVDIAMDIVNKRLSSPIETPKPKRLDRNEKRDRDVDFTGPSYSAGWCRDFSAIQRTRVNPVTGRILGYKGIRRKRALSPTSKYSAFWREQKYAKPSLHAARSPGIWDSARR
jgi:hypothetical protein